MVASYKALAQYQNQDTDIAVKSVTLSLACKQHHNEDAELFDDHRDLPSPPLAPGLPRKIPCILGCHAHGTTQGVARGDWLFSRGIVP